MLSDASGWDASCVLALGAELLAEVGAAALPLVIALRSGATFGRIDVPHRLLLAICLLVAATLSLPTVDVVVAQWVRCHPPTFTTLFLPMADGLLRGLVLGLLIRSTLAVVETIAGALEGHLQLSNESAKGGSFSSLAVNLWAFRWWQGVSIQALLHAPPRAPSDWIVHTVTSLVEALTTGVTLAGAALVLLIFGEIGLGLVQRILPNISAWQFSLPLRLFLGLQLLSVLLRSPIMEVKP